MINEVRSTVMYVLNKDNNGYITPEAFNSYAKQAQIDLLEQLTYDYNNAMVRMNNRTAGTGYGDTAKHIRESLGKLLVYNEELTYNDPGAPVVAHFLLPSVSNGDTNEWFRILNIQHNDTVEIERVESYQVNNLANSMMMSASTTFPTYNQEIDLVYVLPTTIQADVKCTYIRYPYDPKWTYNTVAGDAVFNQSANDYQDFEVSMHMAPKLTVKILKYCGVDIREQEIVQYMNSEEVLNKQLEQ
jgi:hypothetical protein